MIIFICYVLVGCLSGFLAGLVGIGGGLIIIPALVALFSYYSIVPDELIMRMAVATSLATIIITSLVSIHAHNKRDAILWPMFLRISPGIILGGLILSPILFSIINNDILKIIFAFFCIWTGIQILFNFQFSKSISNPSMLQINGAGLFIGTLSSLLGVGGASLTSTFLNCYNVPIRTIIGTSSAIGLPIAVAGTLGMVIASIDVPDAPQWSTGYIYWPAFLGITVSTFLSTRLGAYLTHKLPVKILKKTFAVVYLFIGIKFLF